MRLTLRWKILASFGVVIIFVLIHSLVIRDKMNKNTISLEHFRNKSYAGAVLAKEMELDVTRVQQWLIDISASRAAEGFDIGFEEAEKYAKQFRLHIASLLAIRPDLSKELDGLSKSFEEFYEKGRWMAEEYIKGGPELGNKAMGDFDAYTEDIGKRLGTLIAAMNGEAVASLQSTINMNEKSNKIGLVLSLLIIALTIVVSLILSTKIRNSIKRCIDFAKTITEGNFIASLEPPNNDETGELSKLLNEVNTTLKNNQEKLEETIDMGNEVVTEINRTAGRLKNGKCSERVDVLGVTGNFRLIVEGFNASLDAVITPLIEAANVLTKYAGGDLSEGLETQPGDMKTLSDATTGIRNNLQALAEEGAMLTKAANTGRLNARGDISNFEGVYREIIAGMNNTLDALIGPMKMTTEYMDRISKGDIPGKITEGYKGEFNVIMKSLNRYIDAVHALVAGVNILGKVAIGDDNNKTEDSSKYGSDVGNIFQGTDVTLGTVIEPDETSTVLKDAVDLDPTTEQTTENSDKTKMDATQIGSGKKELAEDEHDQIRNPHEAFSTLEVLASMNNQTTASVEEAKGLTDIAPEDPPKVVENTDRLSEAIDKIIRKYISR